MRLAAAVVTALVLAPAASALSPPPIGLHTIKLTPYKQQAKSCTAQSRSKHAAARVARKLHPVACEQPPRSNVLDAGVIILLAP